MISRVIDKINEGLSKLFEQTEGVKIYGLAQTMVKVQGSETQIYPALVDHGGEGTFVGIDDVSPVITYHKLNSITPALRTQQGFGDQAGLQNTYNNTLIVFVNRKKLKRLPDELFLFIQSRFPDTMKTEPFNVVVRITTVILNSQQVWASEYQKDFKLPPEANLFAVNYTIESSFKKGCFDKCL